jgi:hypothetical protein
MLSHVKGSFLARRLCQPDRMHLLSYMAAGDRDGADAPA